MAVTEKISSRLMNMNDIHSERALTILLNAAQTDIALLRAAIIGINAKLDVDAGVTDTNYAALWNPAAATFLK